MATNLYRATATGAAFTGKGYLKSVALEGGSANSTVQVRDNTSGSGTVILSLAAVIGSSAVWSSGDPDGVFIGTGVHVTLAGAGAAVTVEVE
jgi:hypothetical protein